MADALPTFDEALGSTQGDTNHVPTVDEAFGGAGADPHDSPSMDQFLSQTSAGRVMNAFGQGAKQGWGTDPIGYSGDTTDFLKKAGAYVDHITSRNTLLKAFNVSVVRPAILGGAIVAGSVSNVMRGMGAATEAVESATQQLGKEGQNIPVVGPALDLEKLGQTASEAEAQFVQTGAPELHGYIPHSAAVDLPKARSLGVVGEGEGGYFGTVGPQPETLADRAAAVKQQVAEQPVTATAQPAGEPQTTPASPEPEIANAPQQPDIHSVARQIAPDTFNEYDSLTQRSGTFRRWIDELGEKRLSDAYSNAPHTDEIHDLVAKMDDATPRLQKKYQARIDELAPENDAFIQDALSKDTPDMARVRQELQKSDYRMRDLAPDVASAYRQAQETHPELAETAEPQTVTATQAEPATRAPLTEAEPVGATTEAPAKIAHAEEAANPGAPKSGVDVQGQIASDVSKKLTNAGRPKEEADAAAQLVAAHYQARAERFNGAKGNAYELYAKEGPNIREGGVKAKAKAKELAQGKTLEQTKRGSITLNAARNTIRLFKDADASSFIHETGHQWLEELMRDATDESAPEELKADAKTVRDYIGAEEGKAIPTRGHEKFARGFERYMMEGVAPSKELAGVFAKFKDWLTKIYQTVAKLRSPISDDIRNVFDRLISSNPEKTVLAPERESADLAATHEKLAADTPPEKAGEVADKVRSDIDKIAKEKVPEIYAELNPNGGREPAENANPPSGGDEAGPIGGENGNPQEPGNVPAGGDETAPESGTVSGEPVGADTAGSEPSVGSGNANRGPTDRPNGPNALFAEPESDLVDKAGNIVLDNINAPEDVKEAIRESAKRNGDFMGKRRGVLTDAEALSLAENMGLDAAKLDKRKIGEAFNKEQIFALEKLLIESATNVRNAMRGDDELAYAEAVSRHQMIQDSVQGHASGVRAEAGRALQAYAALKKMKGRAEALELNQMLEQSGGKTLFQLKKEMAAGRLLDTTAKVSGFVRDINKASLGEMLLETFKNWLISGPQTHMMYAIGNKVFALYKAVPETAARATAGAVHEAIVGHQIDRVYFGEVPAQLYAMFYGQRNGLKAAYDSFKAGQTALLPGEEGVATTQFTQTKAVPDFKVGSIPVPLGSIIRAPGERMVAPIHAYDRAVGYETIKAGLIYRRAVSEGLRGDAFNSRMAELAVHTPEDIMEAARGETTEQALMGQPGKFTQNFSRWIRTEVVLPVLGRTQPLSFIEPFVNIGAVINKQALIDRGPLGLASRTIMDDISGKNGSLAQDTAIAKISLGTAVGVAAGGLVMEKLLHPSAPADHKAATLDLMVNGLPHSVRIGDWSYQLNRLGVLGMQLSVAADMYSAGHYVEKGQLDKAGALLIHSVAQNFLDEGYASGISDLMKAIDDSDRYGESYVRNFVSAVAIPFSVGMGQIAHSVDPYAREARTLTDALVAKIPYASESLYARRDIWGEQIPNKDFVGVYASHVMTDKVNTTLLNLGRFPAPIGQKIRGVPLTDSQFDEYSMLAGRMAKLQLNTIVAMPGFDDMPAHVKLDMMNGAIKSSREIARSKIMAEDPTIIQRATNNKTAPLKDADQDTLETVN